MVVTKAPVLVTGITGYLAAHVALVLLQRGYTVRGTVRSSKKANALAVLPHFGEYVASGKLTFVEVADIQKSDFTAALEGVEVVMHVASPFHYNGKNNETDYILPALHGTLNVLKAAHRSNTVKNFVFTSSFAAVMDLDIHHPLSGKVFSESDWNPATYESGCASNDPIYGYCASKVLAERAAYDYQKQNGLESKIKVTSINPPLILGPIAHATDSIESLNQSVVAVSSVAFGTENKELPPTPFPAMVDVRDVAEAHVLAAERDAQGRFLLCAGPYDNQQIADIIHPMFPQEGEKFGVPKGNPGDYIWKNPKIWRLDSSKAQKELGLTFSKSVEDTLTDTIKQLYEIYAQPHLQI